MNLLELTCRKGRRAEKEQREGGESTERERERERTGGRGGWIKESSTREKEIKSLNKKRTAKETGREEVGHKAEEKREKKRDE